MTIGPRRVHWLPTRGDRCRFRLSGLQWMPLPGSGPRFACTCGAVYYPAQRLHVDPLWLRWDRPLPPIWRRALAAVVAA